MSIQKIYLFFIIDDIYNDLEGKSIQLGSYCVPEVDPSPRLERVGSLF